MAQTRLAEIERMLDAAIAGDVMDAPEGVAQLITERDAARTEVARLRALGVEVHTAFFAWVNSNPMRADEFLPAMDRLDAAVKALAEGAK